MKNTIQRVKESKLLSAVGYVLLGALLVMAIRLVTYSPVAHTHYHANFAVYVNGQREEFKSPMYYQDVNTCSAEGSDNPKVRTHMHDEVNDVIHVHAKAVTWGQFFENIGWSLSGSSLITKDGTVHTETDQNKLHIVLNGQDYTGLGSIANRVIGDKDRLLISYGSEDMDKVMAQYETVARNAAKYNAANDPKSCGSGDHGGFGERLKSVI